MTLSSLQKGANGHTFSVVACRGCHLPDSFLDGVTFEYLTVGGVMLPLPFTTRMTVVRLSNGNLFLQSPIKFDEVLASELQRMGTIRHLVSPNQFHYAHIGEWSKAFPDAIPWASPRVRQRAPQLGDDGVEVTNLIVGGVRVAGRLIRAAPPEKIK
jgi:hypothetical protein